MHPTTPTAAVLSVSGHNWPVSVGKNLPENRKCGSFSLSISRDNWTVLRDLRVEHVARNEHYLVMDADRSMSLRGCQTSVKYVGRKNYLKEFLKNFYSKFPLTQIINFLLFVDPFQ